jgi:hypothetical protein
MAAGSVGGLRRSVLLIRGLVQGRRKHSDNMENKVCRPGGNPKRSFRRWKRNPGSTGHRLALSRRRTDVDPPSQGSTQATSQERTVLDLARWRSRREREWRRRRRYKASADQGQVGERESVRHARCWVIVSSSQGCFES